MSANSSGGEGFDDDDLSSSTQMDMFRMFPDESRQFKVALFVVLASHCPAAQRSVSYFYFYFFLPLCSLFFPSH